MKKLIIIIISISLLLGFWQTVQAVDLLLDYPNIPGAGKLGEGEASTLPGVIRYIYMFALGAAGFVALLAILIGAIMYIFSAGKPDKAKDAKDRIMSALLGILILLASVLLLRTINPDLVNIGFELPIISGGTEGAGYKIECVCEEQNDPQATFEAGCFAFANHQECIDTCGPICDAAPGNYILRCQQNYPGCE